MNRFTYYAKHAAMVPFVIARAILVCAVIFVVAGSLLLSAAFVYVTLNLLAAIGYICKTAWIWVELGWMRGEDFDKHCLAALDNTKKFMNWLGSIGEPKPQTNPTNTQQGA